MTPTTTTPTLPFVVVSWRDTSATGGFYSPADVVRQYKSRAAADRYADSPAGRAVGAVVRPADYIRA